MSKLNSQYKYIPNSFLEALKGRLDKEFFNLPKRIQAGYLSLFLRNRRITEANQHKTKADSFKLSSEELSKLFGEYKRFRDVDQNGYCMKPRKTKSKTGQGDYIICDFVDKEAKSYKPLLLLRQAYTGHSGSSKADKGLLSAYKLTRRAQAIIDELVDRPVACDKSLMYMTDLKGRRVDIEDMQAKGIVREESSISDSINIKRLITVSMPGMLLYKLLLQDVQEYIKKHGEGVNDTKDRVIKKDSDIWNNIELQLIDQANTAESIYSSLIKDKERPKPYTRKDLDQLQQKVNRRIKEMEAAKSGGEDTGPSHVEGSASSLVIEKDNKNTSKPIQVLLLKDLSLLNIRAQLSELEDLLIILREVGVWRVPIVYEECGTGRYFASILQGFHKEVRFSALKGYYAYDIEAAHQNILVQIMDKANISFPELGVIREYVENKKGTRSNLAKELNITVAMVKSILQVLTYGSRLSESKEEALYGCCNQDIDIVKRVKNHSWIQSYRKAFDIAFNKYIGNKKKVVNAVGIQMKYSKDTKAQKMAHILQGHERQVLDAIIDKSEFGDIVLLLHDCVVFKGRVDPTDITRVVKKETGFTLSFEEECY
jgi:hypothetical protein